MLILIPVRCIEARCVPMGYTSLGNQLASPPAVVRVCSLAVGQTGGAVSMIDYERRSRARRPSDGRRAFGSPLSIGFATRSKLRPGAQPNPGSRGAESLRKGGRSHESSVSWLAGRHYMQLRKGEAHSSD